MKILLLGDVHGMHVRARRFIKKAMDMADVRACIQLGDFGLTHHTIHDLLHAVGRWPIPTYWIDGNHEAHHIIEALGRTERDGLAELNLTYQPRGSTRTFGTGRVGFLGGALNVERPQEQFPPNYPTEQDACRAADAFNQFRPHLICTHSCPYGIGVGMRGHPAFAEGALKYCRRHRTGPHDDKGEPGLRELWDRLEAKPPVWAYGHWHTAREKLVGNTRFVCVDQLHMEPVQNLVIVWDSETGEITCEGRVAA
jgi:hypothetical protein